LARKALLAGLAFMVVAVALACVSYGGSNDRLKIGIHVKSHPTSCASGIPVFNSCHEIVSTYAGCGDVDVLPVFFDLSEFTVTEFALSWPEEWGTMTWVRCKGTIDVGTISRSGDGTAVAWSTCQSTWSVVPGFGWLDAGTAGLVRIVPNTATGDYGVVDCESGTEPGYDYPVFDPAPAGVCGATGGDPCVPEGGAESTWGGIKAMYR